MVALKKLETFEPYFWNEKFAELHARPELGKLARIWQSVNEQKMIVLSRFLELTSDYPALRNFRRSVYEGQLRLCGRKLRESIKEFRSSNSQDWQLIKRLHGCLPTNAAVQASWKRTTHKVLHLRKQLSDETPGSGDLAAQEKAELAARLKSAFLGEITRATADAAVHFAAFHAQPGRHELP